MPKSSLKFSPAPWYIEQLSRKIRIKNAKGLAVAELFGETHMTRDERLGNAALIWAAPELAQTCLDLREVVAACFRVIAEDGGAAELIAELQALDIPLGFGSRADDVLRRALRTEKLKDLALELPGTTEPLREIHAEEAVTR